MEMSSISYSATSVLLRTGEMEGCRVVGATKETSLREERSLEDERVHGKDGTLSLKTE